MPATSELYRDVLRHFASGVTIVTVQADGVRHGLTVSAFASVSPEPPLVAVCIDHRHKAFPLLESAGATFAVNLLGEDQRELSDRFAWVKDEDRFAGGRWTTARTGAPVLEDALAWLDCEIEHRHPAGTHTVYIGRVVAAATPRPDELPLVYWNRGYRRLYDPDRA
jgi:flavin reductase (DIM6/NTAB) family NADH-FMN oxidoreductase RutF